MDSCFPISILRVRLLELFPAVEPSQTPVPEFFPEPGRPLSLYLGWGGIIIMLLMNLYILRKRWSLFESMGSVSAWLEFHIFCGLLGPTLILFHCNFKVRGLVAISFWSMIVSATSGVVGRYFYVQLLHKRKERQEDVEYWAGALKKMQAQSRVPVADEVLEKLKVRALRFVGVGSNAVGPDGTLQVGALSVFFSSLMGDIRLLFNSPGATRGLSNASRIALKNYALSERKRLFLEPFRNLMGYWHTFHTPFAFFMYAAALIHIAVSLLLGVKK